MAGVNFAVLVGNVGRDPEFHTTDAGTRIARFSLATGEQWKDRNTGEKRERTEWHRVVVWGEGLAGVVENYVRKGSRLFVKGAIRTRDWEGNDGVRRFTTEIHLSGFAAQLVLLDKAGSGGPPPPGDDGYGAGASSAGNAGPPSGSGGGGAELDDEIPF